MGATLTKEHLSSWDQPDVQDWKKRAMEVIKSYYLSFRGSQFDEYMLGEDENLLLAKICFAIYGPPTVPDAKEIWEGYEKEQLENAMEILKLILEVHKTKNNSSKKLLVGIIVIACKQEESEYVLPMFTVLTGNEPSNPHAARSYVDTQRRTYDSWEDWKTNNTLPMLKYAFPARGFFTASNSCSYEFDPDKDPDVSFQTSPACDLGSRIFGTTDTLTAVTSLACGVIGVASMFTPIGPTILLASAVGGGSSALYGTSRAVVRLYDKGTHGGSLTDLESFTLWFSIAATPLHFTTSVVNAQLVRGAVVNGRIFSSSMRMFATVLNFSTLGVDGVMIAFGIANLVDKYKQKQLQPLDVLQFSMSVFFFTNTLIQPKMATSIIKNAQDSHISSYSNNLSDAEAQATFNKFLDSNKGDGGIKDTSKIVRAINRIDDPNKLFGELKGNANIKIGGRKGKTLLVTDQQQNVQRINPKTITFNAKVQGVGNVKFHTNVKKLLRDTNIKDAELDGKKIFNNLTNRQKDRVNKSIGASAGANEMIVNKAVSISEEMGLKTVDEVLSVVEIVAAEVKKDNPRLKMSQINATHLNKIDNPLFVSGINNDINIAMTTANKNGLHFENPLLAVYHYRKHGAEFPSVIRHQHIEVYLTKVPDNLIQLGNLANVETISYPDGTLLTRRTYLTQNDQFAVTMERVDGKSISTLFQNAPGTFEKHKIRAANIPPEWSFAFKGVTDYVAKEMGFRGLYSFLINCDKAEDRFDNKEREKSD